MAAARRVRSPAVRALAAISAASSTPLYCVHSSSPLELQDSASSGTWFINRANCALRWHRSRTSSADSPGRSKMASSAVVKAAPAIGKARKLSAVGGNSVSILAASAFSTLDSMSFSFSGRSGSTGRRGAGRERPAPRPRGAGRQPPTRSVGFTPGARFGHWGMTLFSVPTHCRPSMTSVSPSKWYFVLAASELLL